MTRRKMLAGWALMLGILAPMVAPAQSLSQALTDAYNNSGLLEQNRVLLRAADEDVAQAVGAMLPVISWSITRDRTWITSPIEQTTDSTLARITASVPLYTGGTNRLTIAAQKETVLGTRQALRGVEQDVLLRAVQAYANLVRDTEFLRLRQNNVRVISQEFRAAQDRFDVGEVTRTDVALAEARLASARSLLASAEGNLAIATEEFRIATGVAPRAVRSVSPAPVTRGLQASQRFAVENHPSILQAQHSVAAAELTVRRASAARRPTLSANAFVATDEDQNNSGQIGLTLSGPLYSGGAISSQVRQSKSNRDAARASLRLTVLGVEQQVANAFALLEVARASRRAADQQIAAARVAFEGVREEATLGARTTLDVLNAEQELLDAEANRIAAVSEEVIASYSLLAAMGLMTADHLDLPVQQYDPETYYDLVKRTTLPLSPQSAALNRILEGIGQE